jgi:hypothetical protein
VDKPTVAFGDFYPISREFRLRMLGSGLLREPDSGDSRSAVEHKAEEAFLKELLGTAAVIHIQRYEVG